MTIDWTTLLVAGVSAVFGGGTIAALIQFWSTRRTVKAQTDNLVVEGAKALLEPLTKRVTALEEEGSVKDQRIDDLEHAGRQKDSEIADLRKELDEARGEIAARDERLARIDELERQNAEMKAELARLRKLVAKIERRGTGPLDPKKADK